MPELTVRFAVRDLTYPDLAACQWAGSPLHLRNVAEELHRRGRGVADYLAACPPSDLPVAKCGIDFEGVPGAGLLHQFVVHPALRSCGIGTLLVRGAEDRIRSRGLDRAELKVEENNPRARELYERLGYVAYDRQPDGWDEEEPDGRIRRYDTVAVLMRKQLSR